MPRAIAWIVLLLGAVFMAAPFALMLGTAVIASRGVGRRRNRTS